MSDEEEQLTLPQLIDRTMILHRRVKSLGVKMEQLHKSSDEAKRFLAYMRVLDEYQRALDEHLQLVGFQHVMGDEK